MGRLRLWTKVFDGSDRGALEDALNDFLGRVQYSTHETVRIHYQTTSYDGGYRQVHSALVVYEATEVVEG